ncbi:MAG: hypothetical protein B7Y07_08555 [Halothiobacillus sp. 24-54-40]|jgi:hypothetical protein|nr:DUF2256 domain-containing protein [Halothiobacillaceae bacterium]OYV47119.1 MAG: hypothetical protein B7X12_02295 [Halothiobacillus sp. 20-53-49]OYY40812.1 MAG: hypothetical protein B7Y58_03350 [Halothiobacillus sp. 35-54-62]OYY56076.1 MAG: hypothetical protein B7Y53_02580 [Halothiobacillus sp. 28-55-5]OYZ86292.1 MAG: hypothetical protein B7Y07_08555 [Halothiobacillus sp. 24-54-40]OZA80128.1 MAG: hypothetical protein B7X64_07100 [Halothiobacillus sp. 39-53-45]HQS03412.1 DUF2256 domain-cont
MNRFSNDKAHLPQKICLVCQRPFTWRKKWAKDWAQVKYCSDACRARSKQRPAKEPACGD